MTPYYEDEWSTIYHGDCEAVMEHLSPVDLVLTSPPYNIGSTGGSEWNAMKSAYDGHADEMPHEVYVEWQRNVLGLCWSLLPGDGAIFYNHKPIVKGKACRLPFELAPPHLHLRQVVTWDRCGGFMRQPYYFTPRYEWVLIYAKPEFRLNTMSVFDVWRIPAKPDPAHPAPFPLELATRAIASTDAALVLDPFAGTGTTLRAAKSLGRRSIGIEQSEAYCEIAATRLAQGVLDFGGVA